MPRAGSQATVASLSVLRGTNMTLGFPKSALLVRIGGLLALITAGLSVVAPDADVTAQSSGETIPVISFEDRPDIDPADGICRDATGVCTLRAAVQTANVIGAPTKSVTITLSAGTYRLSIPSGSFDSTGASGDLDLRVPVSILGTLDANHRPATVISAAGISDRVFDFSTTGDADFNVTLSGLVIRDGSGVSAGGGIRTSGRVHLRMYDCDVIDNHADHSGGGVSMRWSGLISNSRIMNNSLSTVSSNETAGGGGIWHGGPGTLVLDALVAGNRSGTSGGGVVALGALNLLGSSIVNNTAVRNGGGVYARGGATWMQNTTIASNTAGSGGGIYIAPQTGASEPPEVELHHSTIAGNRSTASGGGVFVRLDGLAAIPIVAWNSVLDRNFNGSGSLLHSANCNSDVRFSSGLMPVSEGNLSSDTSCPFLPAGNRVNTPAQLGPLVSFTPFYQGMAPQLFSPLLETGVAGRCLDHDGRGVARPQGQRCEIGAIEVVPGAPLPTPTPAPVTPAPTKVPTISPGPIPATPTVTE